MLFGDTHKGIGAGLGGPVETIAVIGKFIAAEGGPVAMLKPTPERMRDGGNGGPGDGREPERSDDSPRSGRETSSAGVTIIAATRPPSTKARSRHAALRGDLYVSRSHHGCDLSVYGLCIELGSRIAP